MNNQMLALVSMEKLPFCVKLRMFGLTTTLPAAILLGNSSLAVGWAASGSWTGVRW